MTPIAFYLILASVFLHAFWHFLSKSSNPSPAFFLFVSGTNLVFLSMILLCTGASFAALPEEVYRYAFLGAVSGVLCDIGLAYAYRLSEVSLAYPLARALPVLLTAVLTLCFGIGKSFSHLAMFGMFLIMCGGILMPMRDFRDLHWKNYATRSMLFIFLAALGTTGYTIFDNMGIHALFAARPDCGVLSGAIQYAVIREFFLSAVLWVYVLCVPFERKMLTPALWKSSHPYLAGIGAGAAYILVLIAMRYVTNVSFVQAFRQMSLPVGMLLGILLLHERCPAPKITGAALVILGLILAVL